MTTRLRSSRLSPRRHCARAACTESTGISRSGSPFTRSITSSPPTMRLSLLASASVFPDCNAASVGGNPTAPTIAFSTMSASRSRASCSAASAPTTISTLRSPASPAWSSFAAVSSLTATTGGMNSRIWPTSNSWFEAAASPTTWKRSWVCRITSRAWVPMEPVEPRMTTLRMSQGYPVRQGKSENHQTCEIPGSRGREQDRVDAIQHPSVAGEETPHVLEAQVTLEGRLHQVAHRSRHRDHQGKAHSSGRREWLDRRHDRQGHEKQDERRADGPLPGFLRADGRSERPVSPQRTDGERTHVVQNGKPKDSQQEVPPRVPGYAQDDEGERCEERYVDDAEKRGAHIGHRPPANLRWGCHVPRQRQRHRQEDPEERGCL